MTGNLAFIRSNPIPFVADTSFSAAFCPLSQAVQGRALLNREIDKHGSKVYQLGVGRFAGRIHIPRSLLARAAAASNRTQTRALDRVAGRFDLPAKR
jgi:hypothetical protein